MGTCVSKRKEEPGRASTPQNPPAPSKSLPHRPSTGAKAAPLSLEAQQVQAGKKQIFIAVANKEKNALLKGSRGQTAAPEVDSIPKKGLGNPQDEDSITASSCTKEEVESILIQCGRLSRNSSAVEDEYRRSRKRSYDLDCPEEGKEMPQPNRASPQRHRRTPSQEREPGEKKRSGSRERGSGGRRVSRSPARRSDLSAAAPSPLENTVRRQTPGRMVSIPAREKPGEATIGARNKIRSASPRSRSPANPSRPANENCPSLSRSSSRKAEHSPYRRNPMSEVDANAVAKTEQPPPSLKPSQAHSNEKSNTLAYGKMEQGPKKPTPSAVEPQKISENSGFLRRNAVVEVTTVASGSTAGRRAKEELVDRARMTQEAHPSTRVVLTRSRSSRRSSRDLDSNQDGIPSQNSYAALLLEDIQNYHQQTAAAGAPAFSLPACLSKACSILDAVADLSSRAEEGHHHRRRSLKAVPAHEELGEVEESAREDLMKPNLHKYGVEVEPQESAGSNSFAGKTPCESTHSVNSAERSWTSSWGNHDLQLQKHRQQLSERGGRNGDTFPKQNGSAASSSNRQPPLRPERSDHGPAVSVA